MLDSALRNQLAKKLRDIHADIEAAEIPPRIARLLGEPPDDRPPRAPPVNEFLGVTTNLLKKLKRQSDTSHEIEPPTPSLPKQRPRPSQGLREKVGGPAINLCPAVARMGDFCPTGT